MHISLQQSIRQNHKRAAESAIFREPSGNAELDVVLDQIRAQGYDNDACDSAEAKGQVDSFDPKTGTTVRASFGDNGEFDFEETRVRTETSGEKTTTITSSTFWSLAEGGDLIHTTLKKTHEEANAAGALSSEGQTTTVADSYILPAATFEESLYPQNERTFDGLHQAEREQESWAIIFGE